MSVQRQSGRSHCKRLILGMASCVILVLSAYGQANRANRGVLLRPQPGTMLASSCSVDLLDLRITTGTDDLRGGKNNLDVEVHLANGDVQTASNVNRGANWPNHSIHTVEVRLNRAVAPNQIKQIRLVHSAQGGYNPPDAGGLGALSATPAGPAVAPIHIAQGIQTEDNWDMQQLQAVALGKGVNTPIASFGFHRFTGSNPALDIYAQPGVGCPTANQVTKIAFTFWTSDDDLRGGNDNLNLTILFTDGPNQVEPNVNRSQGWPNGSTNSAEILLNRAVTLNQIRAFSLADTFTGGSGGDNWNMASMQAVAYLVDGTHHTIAKSGYHRFSADMAGPQARQIRIAAHPID